MLADQLRAVGLGFSHGRRRHSLAAGSTNSFAICSSRATSSRSVPGLPDNKAISSTPASRYRFKSSVLIGLVYGDTARWTSERLRPLALSSSSMRLILAYRAHLRLYHRSVCGPGTAAQPLPSSRRSRLAAPICSQQRARRRWLIGGAEDRTYCKIVIIWRLSALDLVARNIWTPRRNFAV